MKNVTYSKSSAFCNRVLNDRRNEFGCLEDFYYNNLQISLSFVIFFLIWEHSCHKKEMYEL